MRLAHLSSVLEKSQKLTKVDLFLVTELSLDENFFKAVLLRVNTVLTVFYQNSQSHLHSLTNKIKVHCMLNYQDDHHKSYQQEHQHHRVNNW